MIVSSLFLLDSYQYSSVVCSFFAELSQTLEISDIAFKV